jgi:hypothetical protein
MGRVPAMRMGLGILACSSDDWLRFTDINQAIDWEIQLKGWGRKKHCSKKTGKNTQSSTSSD